MKNRIFSMMLMATVLTAWWGCSSSGDDVSAERRISGVKNVTYVDEKPVWAFNVPTPTDRIIEKTPWVEEKGYMNEFSMTAVVYIDSMLNVGCSLSDQMAAIIDGEVREVSTPVIDEHGALVFMLYITYNEKDANVDLHYHNANNNKVYIQKNAFNVNEDVVGSDEAFILSIYDMTLLHVTLNSENRFQVGPNDLMAVMDGDVCYGIGLPEDIEDNEWVFFARSTPGTNPTAKIQYYNAEKNAILTSNEQVQLINDKELYVTPTF